MPGCKASTVMAVTIARDVVWMVGNVGWEGLCFAVACCL